MAALPEPRKFAPAVRERFFGYVFEEPNSGCWLFVGAPNAAGCGVFGYATKKTMLAHRFSWLLAGRVLAPVLRHTCDTPCCVNPDHLRAGSQADNIHDMARKWRGRGGAHLYGAYPQSSGRFQAGITVNGRRVHLGTYDTQEQASTVAKAAKEMRYASQI